MASIKEQINKGAAWTSISTIVITIVQIIQFLILGNIMSLKDFGMVGMLTTVVVFAQIFLEMGLGAAIIQKDQVTHRQLSTLFWLNILQGIFIFLFLQVMSPFIAAYFQAEGLIVGIRLLSFLFLMAPIGQQAQYLLQKDLSFQLLGKIETLTAILSIGILIYCLLATELSPIISFVLSQVFLYSAKGFLFCMVYRKKWKPSFVLDFKACKDLFSFGIYQLASRLVNRVGSSLDVLLIGRFMGMEALGIYNLVYQIITIPVLKINPIITKVAFPVFSKEKHNNERLASGFLYMTRLLSFVSFPLLIGLVGVADLFIPLFFGARWMDAVPVLQVMIFVGILRVLMNPNGSIILAKGKANLAFYWDLGVMIVYGIVLLVAVQSGSLIIVAVTYAIASGINFFFGRWLLKKLIQLSLREYIRVLFFPLVASCGISLIAYWIKISIGAMSLPSYVIFILSIAISGSIYGVSVFVYIKRNRLLTT